MLFIVWVGGRQKIKERRSALGLLNLFKREVPEVGFEFEDLERMFGNR